MNRPAILPVLAALTGAALSIPAISTAAAQNPAPEAAKNVIPYLDEQPVRAQHGWW